MTWRIIILAILIFTAMGCTMTVTTHYPGKHNAIETHDSGRTVYKGNYRPPFPMDPPE